MNYQILKHILQYGVLLCTICIEPHCIPPNGVAKHLRDSHKDTLGKPQRGALVKHSQTLLPQLLEPNEVLVPRKEQVPINGLHRVYGFECTECGKLLGTVRSIEEHCHPHGWSKEEPPMWTQKWMQVRTEQGYITD